MLCNDFFSSPQKTKKLCWATEVALVVCSRIKCTRRRALDWTLALCLQWRRGDRLRLWPSLPHFFDFAFWSA